MQTSAAGRRQNLARVLPEKPRLARPAKVGARRMIANIAALDVQLETADPDGARTAALTLIGLAAGPAPA